MIVKHTETGTVEFVLETDAAETPHLMGSWDGWAGAGIAMARGADGNGPWRIALKLPPGDYQFRYRIGDQWFNDPAADHYVNNGLGGENAVITVGRAARAAGLLAAPKKSAQPRVPGGRGRGRHVGGRQLEH